MHRALLAFFAALIFALPALSQDTGPKLSVEDVTPTVVKSSPAAELAATVQMPSDAPSYDDWAKVATRAENAVEAGQASDEALSSLRAEIVTWREQFSAARGENQVRIKTLSEQIAALGPEPAEGETESETIVAQRAALKEQLALLETPVIAAEIALARANAIVEGIDGLLRARQTDSFISAGPSPLSPSRWPVALGDGVATVEATLRDGRLLLASQARRVELRQQAPGILLFVLISLVLLTRGRSWVARGSARLLKRAQGPTQAALSLVASLGQLAAPLLGIFTLIVAMDLAGFDTSRLRYFISFVMFVGGGVAVTRWIGARVFGQGGEDRAVLSLSAGERAEGRFDSVFLGFVYGVGLFLSRVSTAESYSEATDAVLYTPVLILAGLLLLRIARLVRAHASAVEAQGDEDSGSFRVRLLRLGARWLSLVGIIGPVLLLLGYDTLGKHIVFATIESLALLSVLAVLHRLYLDLYAAILKRSEDEAQNALLPVLASTVTLLFSVPFFALVWGAREAELFELWARVGQGINFGEGIITPGDVLRLIVVFAIGLGVTKLIQGMLKTTVLPKTKIDVGGRHAITAGIGYVGFFFAALIAITAAGINLSSLAIVAGALSVGIGFGLQNIVSNFVSGIILLIERPISEGDWIEAGGQMGFVKDISVRSTRIETFDRTDVVVPNSDLISGVVTNYTRGNKIGRVIVPVGVAYGTDTRRVEEILLEIAKAHPLVAVNPEPAVLFMEFGADSLNFEIRAILSDVNFKLVVQSELNHEIARRFGEEGIEIPFAQRDIWLRNPEALRGESPAQTQLAQDHETSGETARATMNAEDFAEPEKGDAEGEE